MTYQEFLRAVLTQQKFSFSDGSYSWLFHDNRRTVQFENQEYLLLASGTSEENEAELLALGTAEKMEEAKLFVLEEGELTYYTFSLSELFHQEEVLKIYAKLLSGKDKHYEALLLHYQECPGCLYWLATGLMTSEFGERKHNKERNKLVAALLKKLAEADDPRACKELADYYIWEEEDTDAVLNWLTRATRCGGKAALKGLADYIIDKRPDKIDEALAVLEQMRNVGFEVAWATFKEANIYLRGTGKPVDTDKGIKLLEMAVALGYAPAMADLSFFLYHGKGMPANKAAAIALLEKANRLNNNMYSEILRALRTH